MKLDSVSSISGSVSGVGGGGGGGEGDNLLVFEEEKPLMMIGIADYPSMGFKEDLTLSAPPSSGGWDSEFGLGLTENGDKGVCVCMCVCVCEFMQYFCAYLHTCTSDCHLLLLHF